MEQWHNVRWVLKKCQMHDGQTQLWHCIEAQKISIKVVRGTMENWKTISNLKACNSAAQKRPNKKLTSVRNQSASWGFQQQSHGWNFCVGRWLTARQRGAHNFKSALAVGKGDRKIISSLISCCRVADTSGLCSSIRPAEVPATRRDWGIRWSQTGSCRLPNKVEAWTVCCCMFPPARRVRARCSAVWSQNEGGSLNSLHYNIWGFL